jgi:hypothetical protein
MQRLNPSAGFMVWTDNGLMAVACSSPALLVAARLVASSAKSRMEAPLTL